MDVFFDKFRHKIDMCINSSVHDSIVDEKQIFAITKNKLKERIADNIGNDFIKISENKNNLKFELDVYIITRNDLKNLIDMLISEKTKYLKEQINLQNSSDFCVIPKKKLKNKINRNIQKIINEMIDNSIIENNNNEEVKSNEE
jgi:hypothetical protein